MSVNRVWSGNRCHTLHLNEQFISKINISTIHHIPHTHTYVHMHSYTHTYVYIIFGWSELNPKYELVFVRRRGANDNSTDSPLLPSGD